MITPVRPLLRFLMPRRRRQAILLLLLISLGAMFEGIGVGMIFPLAKIAMSPEDLAFLAAWPSLVDFIRAIPQDARYMVIAGTFFGLIVLKNIVLLSMTIYQNYFVRAVELDVGRHIFGYYISRSYVFHAKVNSAHLIRMIMETTPSIFSRTMIPLFLLVVEIFVIIIVSATLMAIDFMSSGSVILVCGLFICAIYYTIRGRMHYYGKRRNDLYLQKVKCLQESFGSIKDVQIVGGEWYSLERFTDIQRMMSTISARVGILAEMRREALEVGVMLGLLGVLVGLSLYGRSPDEILPFLGVFAAAVFRLAPAANRILGALENIRQGTPTLEEALREFPGFNQLPVAGTSGTPIPVQRDITCEKVSFAYGAGEATVLHELTFRVAKGEMIGLAGPSGAGKSTLVEILLGLLEPTSGQLFVDSHSVAADISKWRQSIGYVPQTIVLMDDSIRRNIAFCVPDQQIDDTLVWEALRLAQLDTFVRGLPAGLDTKVGERGGRISGGQRQRIGIARALYRQPSLLVLDEATAALDNETEHEVATAIQGLHGTKTVIIVAHRLSTLKSCDRLLILKEGRILAEGRFEELLNTCPEFRRMAELADLGLSAETRVIPPGQ